MLSVECHAELVSASQKPRLRRAGKFGMKNYLLKYKLNTKEMFNYLIRVNPPDP